MFRTALITGAEGALGQIVARRFAAAGYRVVATRLPIRATPPAALPEIHGAKWLEVDLADASALHAALGGHTVDVLAHCAGAFRWAHVTETRDEDFELLVSANLRSTFVLLRELLPGMKTRGFGRIVLVGARAALQPSTGFGAYAATKAGLHALVAAAADEVRSLDINVNAVLPTVLDTPANRAGMPKADFSTWVAPEALAEIIFSLAEPWGRPIHGALIPVAGRL